MSDALLDGEFPLGHCARCEKEVLVGVTLDERGEERRHCVHCEAETELERVGYASWIEREHCGRPDCGGGRCGRP